ncbi:MAG: rhomboid family intramembrane serine protease [Betaproteobacteria bacterium]|nr:rhomboid family intramembrane serine protease [Betaproteobacteria bacterium]
MSASPDIPNKFARWRDVRSFRRALLASVIFTAGLWWIKILEDVMGRPLNSLGVLPGQWTGLIGVVTAPLIHGSYSHLLANSPPLLILGTLSLYTYPKASRWAIPMIWILSGLGTWLIGRHSSHIGVSGLTHGLMFFVLVLGILRWEPRSIATALVAFLLYGGMVTTIFPREEGVSFEYHLAGAVAGVLAAILWRRRDPLPARKKYSWELEEELPSGPHSSSARNSSRRVRKRCRCCGNGNLAMTGANATRRSCRFAPRLLITMRIPAPRPPP